MNNSSDRNNIIQKLKNGLRRLATQFPWTAGQVVKAHQTGNRPHRFVIKPFAPIPPLAVRDLSDKLQDFDTLELLDFPIGSLDEDDIAPRNTKPISDEQDPRPVFLTQVTFVRGGLLLTFAAQHGTMDIVGEAKVMEFLSKACHGLDFTNEELELGNCDRNTLVKLPPTPDEAEDTTDTTSDCQAADDEARQSSSSKQQAGSSGNTISKQDEGKKQKNVWANFNFSPASLSLIKAEATSTLPTMTSNSESDPVTFISTDDAISAFIWRHMTLARFPRYTGSLSARPDIEASSAAAAAATTTTFARAIDCRPFLDVPAWYPGNLATKTYTTYPVSHLLSLTLGQIASSLRSEISGFKGREIARSTYRDAIVYLEGGEEVVVKTTNPTSRDLSRDVAFSSWSKVGWVWDLDFDMGLGKPVGVRRPAFSDTDRSGDGGVNAMEGVVYLLPQASANRDRNQNGNDENEGKNEDQPSIPGSDPNHQSNGHDRDRTRGIDAVIGLKEEEMERLKENQVWSDLVRWIG